MTIAKTIDAINDKLAGSDQPAATTIEGALKLLLDNVGSGGSGGDGSGGDAELTLVPITAIKDGNEHYWFVSNLKGNDDVLTIFKKPCSAQLLMDDGGIMSEALRDFVTSIGVVIGDEVVTDRVLPFIVPLNFYYDHTGETIVPVLEIVNTTEGTSFTLPLYQDYQVGSDTYKACDTYNYT